MSGPDLAVDLQECRASHARLHRTIDALDDDVARRPSLLPSWSVGHVLTHLSRNAESVVRRLVAAERGEVVDQYGGGANGRANEIEAGVRRCAGDLVSDLIRSDDAVDQLFESTSPDVWSRPVRAGNGALVPAARLVFYRWREVETHHVDLGLDYSWDAWPDELVSRWLPLLLDGLSTRTDSRALMAWVLGRAPAPGLKAWGYQ